MSTSTFLNRYTSLPVLLDALDHRRLTLLNPRTWEDRNDSFYIERYKKKKKLKTVVAACFTTRHETFHHWKIFSDGSGGVCIEFDRDLLTGGLKDKAGFRIGPVTYKYIKEVEMNTPPVQQWPFLKRKAFADEGEFRIIYENLLIEEKTKDLPFDVAAIRQISLSPWLPETVSKSVIKVIKSVKGCGHLRVIRSSLIENAKWRAAIENA